MYSTHTPYSHGNLSFTVALSYTPASFGKPLHTHLHINISNLTSTRSTITIPIINMNRTHILSFEPGDSSVCAFRSLYPLWKYDREWLIFWNQLKHSFNINIRINSHSLIYQREIISSPFSLEWMVNGNHAISHVLHIHPEHRVSLTHGLSPTQGNTCVFNPN